MRSLRAAVPQPPPGTAGRRTAPAEAAVSPSILSSINAPASSLLRTRPRDYALLHVIVLVWGLTSILGRLITLDPVVIVVWRTGIAALAMLGILLAIRLPWPPWRELLPIMGGGALIGAHWILFFLSGRVGA
ncbi:MAG: hypothetical protein EOP86_24185, partial [Verrucomicrobiaceae bacterium]